ncbi:MAG: response regulator [Desulfuromonadales bacterium]|nr:response regulator [Desulfuromonadales bacterium]
MTDRASVLIVDDDAISLRFLERIFAADYRILTAGSGHAALHLLRESVPDVVLLDVMMPGLNGFEVCVAIRNELGLHEIPVLFLTGIDDAEGQVAGLDLGVVDYLSKPFSVKTLKLRVRNYIEMKRRQDQIVVQKRQLEQEMAERHALEAKNRQLIRMSALGEMATGIAHQINNPITGVLSCTELLRKRFPAEFDGSEVLDRIEREGQRVAAIVRALLRVIQPGQTQIGLFDPRDSIDSVLQLFDTQLADAGITLQTELPAALPGVRGDRQKFEQLLLNLINNAWHALDSRFPEADPAKVLRITARCEPEDETQKLCIEVFDQGTGIAPEDLGRIFDPFFTTKPAAIGTGLGLSLCFEIVRQFSGDIQVDSQPGQYTRFTVELPVNGSKDG